MFFFSCELGSKGSHHVKILMIIFSQQFICMRRFSQNNIITSSYNSMPYIILACPKFSYQDSQKKRFSVFHYTYVTTKYKYIMNRQTKHSCILSLLFVMTRKQRQFLFYIIVEANVTIVIYTQWTATTMSMLASN